MVPADWLAGKTETMDSNDGGTVVLLKPREARAKLPAAPRPRDAERTKAEILRAAREEFCEQGFNGARRFRQLLSVDIHKTAEPLALFDQAAQLLQGR